MLRIFRKLRKNIVEKGSPKSYLLNTLGEIFLVVIGILVALQIDDIDQKTQDRKAETKVLNRLMSDIDADFQRLIFIDTSYSLNQVEISEVYEILGMERIEDPELLKKVSLFSGADIKDVNSVRATFDEMLNSGNIYKLKNDTLISQTIEYYRLVDENTYQSREDRREFRNLFYGPDLLDFWYIRSANGNNLELAKKFFANANSDDYKRVVQTVNWSGGLIQRGRNRNAQLIRKNRGLKETLLKELNSR